MFVPVMPHVSSHLSCAAGQAPISVLLGGAQVLRKEQLLRLKQVQHVLNERRLLAAVDHPLIVKMYITAFLALNISCLGSHAASR